MNFEFSEDERAFLDAVDKLVERHQATPATPERLQYSPALERDLAESGFFDAMAIEELGPMAAAAMVMAVSQLPTVAELSTSALVAPWLCPDLPRPYALLGDRDDAATRSLPMARTVIRVRGATVEAAAITAADVRPVDSIFAYPMGVLIAPNTLGWKALAPSPPGGGQGWGPRVQTMHRIGIAAEITGSLQAALASVLQHVKDRRQFNRPLGTFQSIQHRLAECATQIEGAKWLTLKAASTQHPLDAALAAAQAQDIARKVAYDLHQFMGAMGLTLEHPLHRWTYRTKLLRSDLGGADRNYMAAAEAAWA